MFMPHSCCKKSTDFMLQQAGKVDTEVKMEAVGLQLIRKTYLDRRASVHDALTPDKPVGGVHSDGPHSVFSQMLCDLQDKSVGEPLHLQRCHDGRKIAFKVHIHDGTDHL